MCIANNSCKNLGFFLVLFCFLLYFVCFSPFETEFLCSLSIFFNISLKTNNIKTIELAMKKIREESIISAQPNKTPNRIVRRNAKNKSRDGTVNMSSAAIMLIYID